LQNITCLDILDGSKIWEKKIGVPGFSIAPPVVAYGNLYVSSGMWYNPYLFCFGEDPDYNSESPSIPMIDGPSSGIAGTRYNFTLFAWDPEGDDICYRVDWGDGNVCLYGPYLSGENAVVSYDWSCWGNFSIKAQSRDINLKNSSWSDPFFISIEAAPPVPPSNPVPLNNSVDVDVNANLFWDCDYQGGDPIGFDVYFEMGDSTPDILVSENQTLEKFNPGHLNHSTEYYWQVVMWNILGESASGPVWKFTTEDNVPPDPPIYPKPGDGAVDVDINATLEWDCNDPDDDPLTFDVYFGNSSPPPMVSGNQSDYTFNPGTLDKNTKYYWKVVAWDYLGYMAPGNIWSFTTGSEANQPPYIPGSPFPEDDADNIGIDVNLSWEGGDPDGDMVFYDVYFEADNPDPKVKIAKLITETCFDPGVLDFDTVYYWKVIAWDNHYGKSEGPVWCFTTEGPNVPPNATGIVGPSGGKPGIVYDFVFNAVDFNDDNVRYYVDWGDNSSDITGFNSSGTDVVVSHIWDLEGIYTISVFAEDEHGLIGPKTTKTVTMPRDKSISGSLLLRFLERYPLLNRLLNIFIK
jgi:hypothetical protein